MPLQSDEAAQWSKARSRRPSFSRFMVFALLLYALFMIPWPGVRSGYEAVFRGLGNVTFSRFWFWPQSGVRFIDLKGIKPGDLAPGAPELPRTDAFDTLMELRTRGASQVGYMRTSARYAGYLPIALFLALFVATPMAGRRKFGALLLGLALVHGFILLRLTLTLLAGGFAAEKSFAIFHPNPFWHGVLTRSENVLADNPTMSYVAPALIWFVVSFHDLRRLVSRDRAD